MVPKRCLFAIPFAMLISVTAQTERYARASPACFGQPPTFSCTIGNVPGTPGPCNQETVTFCDAFATVIQPEGVGAIMVGDCRNGFPQLSDDVMIGSPYGDAISGSEGDDLICARGGADVVDGGSGNDVIDGGAGRDCLNGGEGNDQIFGNGGNDSIFGGGGADLINGGLGDSDVCIGGPGVDAIVACETAIQGSGVE